MFVTKKKFLEMQKWLKSETAEIADRHRRLQEKMSEIENSKFFDDISTFRRNRYMSGSDVILWYEERHYDMVDELGKVQHEVDVMHSVRIKLEADLKLSETKLVNLQHKIKKEQNK